MGELHLFQHPLIQHKLSIIRDKNTGVKEFREVVAELANLMCYEATRDFPTEEVEIETPMGPAKVRQLAGKKMAIVPILRAGLGMVDGITRLIPFAKIGHIGLTAHMETVFERALEMDWVETVMFPYNVVETQGEALMKRCTEQGVGFICMKPLAGGALEDADLALRFIAANEDVSVVIPGMYAVEEIEQNLAAVENEEPLSSAELEKIETIRRELGTQFCRRCNYCQPCTAGIGIAGIFVLEGYLQRYGLGDWAKMRYAGTEKKAGDCIGCGVCETRCPYQLPIRAMLARCKEEFGA